MKPLLDRVVALIFLIIFLPLMLLIGIILMISSRRSPVFFHLRPGLNCRSFYLLKFRTMLIDDDEGSVSGIGKFLRSTSLDELPQLINVLKGDMSIVGPRPLLPEYISFYNEIELTRQSVKPGITGWAQVKGRNKIDWGKRMEFDVYYVRNISFALDVKILLMTFIQLFKRDDTTFKNEKTIRFSDYASRR